MASGKVTIYFKGGNGQATNKTTLSKDGKVVKPNTTQETQSNKKTISSAIVRRGVKVVSALIMDIATYEINKYYDLSDNVRAKREKTIATSLVKRVSQNVNSAWTGANIGSLTGTPIGTAIGAIIGGVTDLAKQSIEIAHGYDKQSIEIAKMNEQLQYSRLSVGYSLMSDSRGEER